MSGQAKQVLGCVGVVLLRLPALLGAAWLVSHSYLAGVDATLWVTSTQVLSVDGPCIPEAAVTEPDVNKVDLGLLQDITWSLSCEHRKE